MEPKPSKYKPKGTRRWIIQAASVLFSQKGYSGITTRAIAESAGVNEVTLFRHLGSKENLAREIMNQFGGLAVAENIENHLSGNFQADLMMTGKMMMIVMTDKNDAMRMAICEAGHFPEFRDMVAENPRQLRLMLARYFQAQMDANKVYQGHPEIMAQAFLGMFFSYTVLKGFLMDDLEPELPLDEITTEFVDLL